MGAHGRRVGANPPQRHDTARQPRRSEVPGCCSFFTLAVTYYGALCMGALSHPQAFTL